MFSMTELSKRSKTPFLVFVLLLCVPLFALSVGASENLVPTDMRQWQVQSIGTATITYYAGAQGNEITLTPQGSTYVSVFLSGVNYVAGHTYQLSFGSTYNEVAEVEWGFAYPTANGVYEFITSSTSITNSNSMSFVAPNTINSVYVVFSFNGNSRQNIQINHLLCVDVTASEQQAVIDNSNENTNKIGGWFSDLWDNISAAFTNLFDGIRSIFYSDIDVVLVPEWVHSYVYDNGTIAVTPNVYSASTSDLFYVEFGGVVTNNLSMTLKCFKYSDSSGNIFVGKSDIIAGASYTFDTGYYYRLYANGYAFSVATDLTEYCNARVTVTLTSKLSVFDRLQNMILYFNANGSYTNPFTFGDIEGVSEYVTHIQGAFDGFNDGISNFVAPIGVVNAVLDEVVGEWGFVAVAVSFVLSALVLIRFLGV